LARFSTIAQFQLQLFCQHSSGRQNSDFPIGQLYEQPPISQRLDCLSGLGGGITKSFSDPAPAETISRAGGTLGLDQKSL
jgi:hypothetical protein